jgi:hypothetical protein
MVDNASYTFSMGAFIPTRWIMLTIGNAFTLIKYQFLLSR